MSETALKDMVLQYFKDRPGEAFDVREVAKELESSEHSVKEIMLTIYNLIYEGEIKFTYMSGGRKVAIK